MKRIVRKKTFEKYYRKRIQANPRLDKQFSESFLLFANGERGYPLNDHALTGKLTGKRAFSVNSDIRVIYEELDDTIVFLDIGTHNQVYN